MCEAAVTAIFPEDLVEWATGEADAAVEEYRASNKKKGGIRTEFPVEKVGSICFDPQ